MKSELEGCYGVSARQDLGRPNAENLDWEEIDEHRGQGRVGKVFDSYS